MRPNNAIAFTLVELMVALSLVGILAAALVGVIQSSKNSINTTRCIANIYTIGRAMREYGMENNGYFPPHSTYPFFEASGSELVRKARWSWITYLAPYLNSPDYSGPMDPVFECPGDEKAKTWPKPRFYLPGDVGNRSHLLTSYGYNYVPLTTSASWVKNAGQLPKKMYVIGNPAHLILVSEGPAWGGDPGNPSDPIVHPNNEERRPALRHRNRFNAVFLDGHAESIERTATLSRAKYWDPE